MAVILSATDETYRDKYVYAGLLAPLKYWQNIFASRWDKMVLGGVPQIPFLHMTDIRSRSWREKFGISETEAERRVDNAVEILCKRKEPTWIGFEFSHSHFNDNLRQKVRLPTGAIKIYSPDDFAFYGYVYAVLTYVKMMYPGARKVDFLVEQNGEVTKNLHYFYDNFEASLKETGAADCTGMLGEIIPGGKGRSPLQAADLVCWYLRRARENSLKGVDLGRYQRLAKKQYVIGLLEDDSLTKLRDNLKASAANEAQG